LANTQRRSLHFPHTHTKQKQKQQLKLKTPKTILRKPKEGRKRKPARKNREKKDFQKL